MSAFFAFIVFFFDFGKVCVFFVCFSLEISQFFWEICFRLIFAFDCFVFVFVKYLQNVCPSFDFLANALHDFVIMMFPKSNQKTSKNMVAQ